MSDTGTSPPPVPTNLTPEQAAAAHAPLDQPLMILAAAGTGKTTTMLERCRFMLEQGVSPEQLLVLTFSRRAAAEFQQRLRQRVPTAEAATVTTFHSWSWALLRRQWREAGYARRPAIVAAEDQLAAVMRDCIVWDRLGALSSSLRGWLFLPPSAGWADIAGAVAERQAALYSQCLQAAVAAHNAGEPPASWLSLSAAAAAARPFAELPAQLQMLLACELHAALAKRFGGAPGEADCAADKLLAAAGSQAGAYLSWVEAQKRHGRMPAAEAYAALCAAAAAAGGGGASPDAERQMQLMRVGAAFQEELRRLNLVALADLPLLARRLLAAGGAAAAWARERWTAVVVDEFQDTGQVLLDLLSLLQPRSCTVVGDDDQCIYSFLASSPDCFAEFQRRFIARQLCLQTNFRSTPAICSFGGSLLRANRRASQKSMQPARGGVHPVAVHQYSSAVAEAEALATEVQRLWNKEGVPYSSVAALYRCLRLRGTAPHAPLADALRRRGIPWALTNHDRLADDPGVAALISYLALAADPGCDPAFEAVLGLPYHALGQDVQAAVTQQRLAAKLAGQPPPSLLECAEQVCTQAAEAEAGQGQGQQVAASQLALVVAQMHREDLLELQRVVQLLRRMQQAVGREPLPRAVQRVLHESGLVAYLMQQQQEQQQQEQQEQHDAAAAAGGGGQGQAAVPLPPKLKCVLRKAQQLAAEWQAQQAKEAAAAAQQGATEAPFGIPRSASSGGGDGDSSAAEGSLGEDEDEGVGSQQGIALVHELLARLAMDSAADDAADSADSDGTPDSQQQQQQRGDGPGVLTISTIHAAKGLEWPVVLVPSANQGHLPMQWRPPGLQAGGGGELDVRESRRAHLEEERRLFHVAATRARDRLIVSFVQPPPPPSAAAVAGCDGSPWDQGAVADTQEAPLLFDPSDLPRCSAFLAASVRHLRRQPGVLRFEGRLPEEQYPGLFDHEADEEDQAQRQSQRQSQLQSQQQQAGCGRPLASSNQGDAGQGVGSQGSQLSIADRVRQQLAARGGAMKKAAGKTAVRRKPALLHPPMG